ncbi:MAG: lysylphosphatidylglycerol synthase domain-containing protein [Cyanobacteria bacterium P01_C01_bin.121]
MSIKAFLSRVKPYLRWVILGGTLFFIAKTLKDHWQEVTAIQVTAEAWYWLVLSLFVTLVAHVWSGWVWHWILVLFGQTQGGLWSTPVYLKTNVAKYLPGNVWHFFGRVRALQSTGTSAGIAVLTVVMEPLLMAVAALILACLFGWQLGIEIGGSRLMIDHSAGIRGIVLVGALVAVHPRIFNPILQRLSWAKAKAQGLDQEIGMTDAPKLKAYPVRSLLGEMGFVGLRSLGFLLIVGALTPVTLSAIPTLIAAFSLAWLFGLVVPGAPGGIGVFEATAISLLSGQLPVAIVLSSVAIYRLVSVLAEVGAAGLVWVGERFVGHPS